jgi:hypothetical protein
MNTVPSLAIAHLTLRLRPLNRALRAAIERQSAFAARLAQPDLSALCLTEGHVRILLDQVDDPLTINATQPASLYPEEELLEDDLRRQAGALGVTLPLDRLVLTAFEQQTLLLCTAPELDRAYERIYAFILDDLNRRFACVDLLSSLTASSKEDSILQRHALGAHGRLRRTGLLVPFGDPPSELRQEFRLAPGLFDFLTGGGADMSRLCRDRAEVAVPDGTQPPPQMGAHEFDHLCDALRGGHVTTLGIWGPRRNGAEELVLSLAQALRRPLRRLLIPELDRPAEIAHALAQQLKIASALDALLWVDTDSLARDRALAPLAEALVDCCVPVFLTGENPWRSVPALQSGAYAELELSPPAFLNREELWSRCLPELDKEEIHAFASRYSLPGSDIRLVSNLARTRARLAGNGVPDLVGNHVAAACSVVTRRSASRFAAPSTPKRRPEDLILPEPLYRQILEVAKFFQLQSRVDEDWGFGRMASGSGLKVLFTGDPGTGKTLSAEVIASILGLSLCKVDLANIVSKWVGETEKNLDATFQEAEESHSVLFFDEAEALFGKRGEVQSGTDRYANLEVSYLLQRLEACRGLVILASNVKDQIDPAFIRRFQVVVHFPRPGLAERQRMWRLAFPESAPVEADVNLAALARLEMTGAAIMSAARNAALLAADSASSSITMAHVIHATARQFRREARVLTPPDLGSYGALLLGAS